MKNLLAPLSLAAVLSAPVFANDITVQPGEAAYVTHDPWLGFWMKKEFLFVLTGPTSTGFNFTRHMKAQKIMISPQTKDEEFELVDGDQVKIDFAVHFTVHPDPARIKELVERCQGANWYEAIAKQAFRTMVRDALGSQDGRTLSVSQDRIQNDIRDRAEKWISAKDYPFIIDSINVGNFVFPESIQVAAAERQAAHQRLQMMETQVDIARKEGEKKVVEAQAIKEAQDIINATLTPIYVQHEYVQALKEVANKAGNQIIYIPIGPNGLPIVAGSNPEP